MRLVRQMNNPNKETLIYITYISRYRNMNVCGMERMPLHKLRYMGQMSNNNKIPINNLLCCFAIRVVYIQIMIT